MFKDSIQCLFQYTTNKKALIIKRFIPINDLNSETLSSFLPLESFMAENNIVKISLELVRDMTEYCESLITDIKE